jgi:hypothetical protein
MISTPKQKKQVKKKVKKKQKKKKKNGGQIAHGIRKRSAAAMASCIDFAPLHKLLPSPNTASPEKN